MTSKTYRLSPTFCDDHWESERGGDDVIVKRGKFCVYVRLDAEGYADMLSRAQFYCEPGDWAEGVAKVRSSARRVLAVLLKEGPPEPAATQPDPATVSDDDTKWVKFGWCTDGPESAHGQCRVEFFSTANNTMHRCKCDCHKAGAADVQW